MINSCIGYISNLFSSLFLHIRTFVDTISKNPNTLRAKPHKAIRINVRVYLFFLLFAVSFSAFFSEIAFAQNPESYATFHSISLYWNPANGASDNECIVRFRAENEKYWKYASSLWFDTSTHPEVLARSNEYRGSIIDLVPGTLYEIQLELKKTGTKKTIFQETLSEEFKIKKVITLDSGVFNQSLVITEGGSEAEGYVLYESADRKHIIDLNMQYNNCIDVRANYVIIRGVTMRNSKQNGILLQSAHHIVIEGCDISHWGSPVTSGTYTGFGIDQNSAIFSGENVVSHLIIQRNKLHHPNTDSNSWLEPVKGTHPQGPQSITLKNSNGYHIIRYNEIYSDMEHMFNDGMGSVKNNSFDGFPHRDSDIYGNKVSHCWDDPIEAEGAGMNVRIWSNSIDTSYQCFGLAPQSLGPCYVYRNVGNYSQRGPKPISQYTDGGSFFKIGAPSTLAQYSKGRLYIFHNTVLQPKSPAGWSPTTAGENNGLNFSEDDKVQSNIMTRNNILHARAGKASISDKANDPTNSYNYDLYNGSITAAAGNEKNGIIGTPLYSSQNNPGERYLASTSPGINKGLVILNFNDTYLGTGPDIGAFENGLPPLSFGLEADWNVWVDKINELYTYTDTLSHEDTTTSIINTPAALWKKEALVVYPNPTSGKLWVKLSENLLINRVTLFNALGQKVLINDLKFEPTETLMLDISNLQKGIYIIEAQTDTGVLRAFASLLK